MGTPLKKLPTVLSAKVLSPLSPRQYVSPKPKINTPLNKLSAIVSPRVLSSVSSKLFVKSCENVAESRSVSPHIRRLTSAKKLEFSKFARKSNVLFEPVKIHVTEYRDNLNDGAKKNDIFINTPKKNDIIEKGVEDDRFLNILGKGGFGKVIRAVYRDTTVAMKLIKTSKFSCRENNSLHLQHNNIVKTLHIIGSEKNVFSMILMEYFPASHNMQSILEDTEFKLDDELIVKYAKDICNGLLHCHENDILHLDLKPQNILLCGDVCKICDFGNSVRISKLQDNFEHQGTVAYTAPELLQGKKPSEKSDVYSFGVLLWQMLVRKYPYSEIDNAETVIYMVVKCHLRPDMESPSNKYSVLYYNCWQSDPSKRPNVPQILNTL